MKLTNSQKLNHIKIQKLQQSSLQTQFTELKLIHSLKKLNFIKKRGCGIIELFYIYFLVIIEKGRSINESLQKLCLEKYKSPINDLINQYDYKWSKLLLSVSHVFMKNFSEKIDDCKIIIDDTKKEKSGRKVDYIAWFFDHSQQRYYYGFQNIVMAFYNGVIAIPIEFKFKIGRKRLKKNKEQRKIPKGSETEKELNASKQSKNKIVLKMLKRVMRRKKRFQYILWDSWYNTSESIKYIFEKVVPNNIHLISMQKRSNQIFRYKNGEYNLKKLYKMAGKWHTDQDSGMKYKSIIIEYLDVNSSKEYKLRKTVGEVKICFYKYPNVKNYKILITTNLSLNEFEVLQHYLCRWSIEVMFKDLKQYFGYDQNQNSKYSAMIGDFTLRSILYIFFANLKMKEKQKSIGQLVLNLFRELEEISLTQLINSIFIQRMKETLDYAVQLGYKSIIELRYNIDNFLILFFNKLELDYNIMEV